MTRREVQRSFLNLLKSKLDINVFDRREKTQVELNSLQKYIIVEFNNNSIRKNSSCNYLSILDANIYLVYKTKHKKTDEDFLEVEDTAEKLDDIFLKWSNTDYRLALNSIDINNDLDLLEAKIYEYIYNIEIEYFI